VKILSDLKLLRKNKGLTQAELAELTGFSQQYISDLETNQAEGSISSLKKIAKALNVKLTKLIKED
jgi:transcriptional regulator with XRE-family HTH domain